MYSNNLRKILLKIKFWSILLHRLFKILFRKNRKIEMLHLDYSDEGMFENGYMVLNYRFRNAIYYKFGRHITLEKNIKIFDSNNFEKEFELTVFGFFEKKKYHLQFEPKLKLITSDFKTNFLNLKNDFEFKEIPDLNAKNFDVELTEINIKPSQINLLPQKLIINHKRYNKDDFL